MRHHARILTLAAVSLSFRAAQAAPAGAAEAYLKSASLFGGSEAIVARLDMRIFRGGSETDREVELSLDRSGEGTKTLARIVKPSFLSAMKFLKVSAPGQADAQWLKTSRGLRRLGSGGRSEPVFDSDFTVEDFGSLSSAGFALAFAPERDAGGRRAVAARPLEPAPYAMRIVYVDERTRLLVGMDYLDGGGAVIKRYRVTSIVGDGPEARPDEALMEDLKSGGSTRLKVLSFSTPASIPSRTFNAASL
jgi:hypothetical protein